MKQEVEGESEEKSVLVVEQQQQQQPEVTETSSTSISLMSGDKGVRRSVTGAPVSNVSSRSTIFTDILMISGTILSFFLRVFQLKSIFFLNY